MIKTGSVEERPQGRGAHKISLLNRRTASIGGVSDVISFDISAVLLETELGMLQIKGADLHVNRLSLEKGEIDLEGRIDSIQYSEVSDLKKSGESLLNRLFRVPSQLFLKQLTGRTISCRRPGTKTPVP